MIMAGEDRDLVGKFEKITIAIILSNIFISINKNFQ